MDGELYLALVLAVLVLVALIIVLTKLLQRSSGPRITHYQNPQERKKRWPDPPAQIPVTIDECDQVSGAVVQPTPAFVMPVPPEPEPEPKPPEPEPLHLARREVAGVSRRGVDATRITMISVREHWSDGTSKDRVYVQRCVGGPWFEAETGKEETYNSTLKLLDGWESSHTGMLLEEQSPTAEDIFRGIVENLSIKKGVPYGNATQQKQLPGGDDEGKKPKDLR